MAEKVDARKPDLPIQKLIDWHESSLQEHRQQMGSAAIYLEEQTIKRLKQLQAIDK